MLAIKQSELVMLAKTSRVECTFYPCEWRGQPAWELRIKTAEGAEAYVQTVKGEKRVWRQLNNAITDLLSVAPELCGKVLHVMMPASQPEKSQ